MFLTVDANGNDATMEGFDPDNIDPVRLPPACGRTSAADWSLHERRQLRRCRWQRADAGRSGARPPSGTTTACWTDYFIPNDNYVNSDLLAQGNTFGSGAVAMNPNHTWYTCCFEDVELGRGGHALLQRQPHLQAARRHLWHPEGQQEPRGRLRGLRP